MAQISLSWMFISLVLINAWGAPDTILRVGLCLDTFSIIIIVVLFFMVRNIADSVLFHLACECWCCYSRGHRGVTERSQSVLKHNRWLHHMTVGLISSPYWCGSTESYCWMDPGECICSEPLTCWQVKFGNYSGEMAVETEMIIVMIFRDDDFTVSPCVWSLGLSSWWVRVSLFVYMK